MNKHSFRHAFLILAIIAGLSAIVMFLWNTLIPGILGLATINFWQALGLLVLARVLFGSINSNFSTNREIRLSRHNLVHEKWMKMTPEERKEFIRHRHYRHGFMTDFFNGSKTGKES